MFEGDPPTWWLSFDFNFPCNTPNKKWLPRKRHAQFLRRVGIYAQQVFWRVSEFEPKGWLVMIHFLTWKPTGSRLSKSASPDLCCCRPVRTDVSGCPSKSTRHLNKRFPRKCGGLAARGNFFGGDLFALRVTTPMQTFLGPNNPQQPIPVQVDSFHLLN